MSRKNNKDRKNARKTSDKPLRIKSRIQAGNGAGMTG